MKKTTKAILIVFAVGVAVVAILIFVFVRALNADGEDKSGRASNGYRKNFWNAMRFKVRCRM